MSSMKSFYTRSIANAGINLPIPNPDGTESAEWLLVLGMDSDPFRKAQAAAHRNLLELAKIEESDKRAQAIEQDRLKVLASLIADWSFDEECNEENKLAFLKECPTVADLVDHKAAKRADFFTKSSESSTSGRKGNSSSPKRQKAQKPLSEST